MYCSSHTQTVTPSTYPVYKQPEYKPVYSIPREYECQYAQCSAIKKDGNRCKSCTGNNYSYFCSSHQ